ncbi:MAG: apaG [Gammaproteobacteria bacterium]|nr:apaG [Gammaproteobacteria bacterium]
MKKMNISVTAKAVYLPDQSSAEEHRFLWSYEITILNQSDQIVQLLNRCWRITDVSGHIEEVQGPGVIGLQPLIKVGKSFSYASFCQLLTPQGSMEGSYEMQTLDEERFTVQIPKFILISPMSAGARTLLH